MLFSKERIPRVDRLVVVGPGRSAAAADLNPFQRVPVASHSTSATPKWSLSRTATAAALTTAKLKVSVDLSDGAVTFANVAGKIILAETHGAHRMMAATVQGEQTYHNQQMWRSDPDESLYGLGQRQEGKLDVKGYDFDLWQRNMVVVMPFLVSSRGYGILWDNTSFTKFGDIRPFEPVPGFQFSPTAAAATGAIVGTLDVPVTGDYQFRTYSNGTVEEVGEALDSSGLRAIRTGPAIRAATPCSLDSRKRRTARRSRSGGS